MPDAFMKWRAFALHSPYFPIGKIIQRGTATELRDDVVFYVNPCEGMPVERIVAITGGQRVVIVADLEEPPAI